MLLARLCQIINYVGVCTLLPDAPHYSANDRFHSRFNAQTFGVEYQVVVDGIADISIE